MDNWKKKNKYSRTFWKISNFNFGLLLQYSNLIVIPYPYVSLWMVGNIFHLSGYQKQKRGFVFVELFFSPDNFKLIFKIFNISKRKKDSVI